MDQHDGDRVSMIDYWKEFSTPSASVVEMMLDRGGEKLASLEQPEILSYLPDFTGKRVVDLGAGIGRYTSTFARSAYSVFAIDFMKEFIEKNETMNNHYKNIEFQHGDVTKLQRDNKSADFVFSNWLLMYMSDAEVQELLQKVLECLDEDGYLFVRESCIGPSGDYPVRFNPTIYRNAMRYEAFFASSAISCGEGQSYGFECVLSTSVDAYSKLKGNRNQIVWLLQKVKRNNSTNKTFTDLQETCHHSLIGYQLTFGCTSVGTDVLEAGQADVGMLGLKPHHTVLEVGCGLGDRSVDLAKRYGCRVVGVTMSKTNRRHGDETAKENAMGPDQVKFEFADLLKRNYPNESFHAIYSRDSICTIADKTTLFGNFYKWLKPGGKVLISDYCSSTDDHSDVFRKYVQQRGYTLYNPVQYRKTLEEAGFVEVRVEDKTKVFTEALTTKLSQPHKRRSDYIWDVCQKDGDNIVSGWEDTLHLMEEEEQRWVIFFATKPTRS